MLNKRNEAENTMQANILPFLTQIGQNVKHFFLHIKLKRKKCRTFCKFDLMHTFDLLGWVKRSDIEIVQIRIF